MNLVSASGWLLLSGCLKNENFCRIKSLYINTAQVANVHCSIPYLHQVSVGVFNFSQRRGFRHAKNGVGIFGCGYGRQNDCEQHSRNQPPFHFCRDYVALDSRHFRTHSTIKIVSLHCDFILFYFFF